MSVTSRASNSGSRWWGAVRKLHPKWFGYKRGEGPTRRNTAVTSGAELCLEWTFANVCCIDRTTKPPFSPFQGRAVVKGWKYAGNSACNPSMGRSPKARTAHCKVTCVASAATSGDQDFQRQMAVLPPKDSSDHYCHHLRGIKWHSPNLCFSHCMFLGKPTLKQIPTLKTWLAWQIPLLLETPRPSGQ